MAEVSNTKVEVTSLTLTLSGEEARVLHDLLYSHVRGHGRVRDILTDSPDSIAKALRQGLVSEPKPLPVGVITGDIFCKGGL